MRKLSYFLLFLLVIIFLLYFFSDVILTEVSEWMISYLSANIKVPNVEYVRPIFKHVSINSFNSIAWYGIVLNANIVRDEIRNVVENVTVRIDKLTVWLDSIAERTIVVNMQGLSADATTRRWGVTEVPKGPPNRIEGGDLFIKIKVNFLKRHELLAQIRSISDELRKFSQTGVTKLPIKFSAAETFDLDGKFYTVKVRVEPDADQYRLIVDEDSLQKIAASMPGFPLTKGDLKLLSRNSIRAPQLLRIRNKALTTVNIFSRQFANLPLDAYRHVLWSYLLTKAYGEEFAKECGDAHEMMLDKDELKLMEGNMEPDAASYQDFNNDAVGRSYALRGYEESTIMERVLTDPAVIRDSEIMARFDPGKLKECRNNIVWYLRTDKKK